MLSAKLLKNRNDSHLHILAAPATDSESPRGKGLKAFCYTVSMGGIANAYGRLSPAQRVAVKAAFLALATFLWRDLSQDHDFDGGPAFWDAVKVAGSYLVAAFFTPLEPFVGFNKPDKVAVPSPPAVDEDSLAEG